MAIQIALGILLGFIFILMLIFGGFIAYVFINASKAETKKRYDFDDEDIFDDEEEDFYEINNQ